ARFGERERFLGASSKEQRVATLQADDALSGSRERDERLVDLLLLLARVAEALSDVAKLGVARRIQQGRMSEPVIEHDIRRAKDLEPAHGDEARISRAGADQPNLSRRHVREATSNPNWPLFPVLLDDRGN